MQSRTAGGF
ncbi:hypothetical protein MC885_021416 [Smutsia gigantea]|nr:hypothetical protein MC885_021416 [Smutsia gigantea]